jgi:Zn-dependent peptidase ImmA (M78 family)
MDYAQKKLIIEKARQLLIELWNKREELGLNVSEAEDLFPLQLDIVIQGLLGIKYEEPVEFPSLTSLTQEIETLKTAGFMDRLGRRIVVPQNFKIEWRRFTAAHEVAHWILHPEVKYHRDRPITGAERANFSLSIEEQEANLFAAYLLMPSKIVNLYFKRCFGKPIDGRQPNEELAVWLSSDSIELAKRGSRYRALLISQQSSYKRKRFIPLADRFGVSPTAMAIQLEELGLVK